MAATPIVSMSFPKPRDTQEKIVKVVRTDTTAFLGAELPRDAVISGLYVIGTVASDAATTATVSLGTSASANELINGFDVKTAATATGYNPAGSKAVGTAMMTKLTVDTNLYAKYAETGTASTTGGPWFIKVEYFVPGPGEDVQM